MLRHMVNHPSKDGPVFPQFPGGVLASLCPLFLESSPAGIVLDLHFDKYKSTVSYLVQNCDQEMKTVALLTG